MWVFRENFDVHFCPVNRHTAAHKVSLNCIWRILKWKNYICVCSFASSFLSLRFLGKRKQGGDQLAGHKSSLISAQLSLSPNDFSPKKN